MKLQHELFICKCQNTEHQMIFSHFPDDQEDKEVYVSIHLIPDFKIWRRIVNAIRYIFGYRCKYGHFDEFILDHTDADKLQKIVDILKLKNS